MQAIILAAGMGKRLGEYTKDNTKCMLPVNGVRLIDRTIDILCRKNISKLIMVVGYKAQNVIDYLGNRYENQIKIDYIHNDIYDKTNNIYSLALAKKELCEDDTILLESDLIFDESMLDLLIKHKDKDLALVAKAENWMDGTMVTIDEERNILNFVSKDNFDFNHSREYYKTVNIYKFSKEFCANYYVPFLEAYTRVMGNNEYYEQVLRVLLHLHNSPLKALPITNEKWYEIDDKQDLDIAEALFAEDKDILGKYYGRYGGFWRFPKMLDYCYLVNPYFNESRIIEEMKSNFNTLVSEYPSGLKVNTLLASKCWGVKEEYIIPGNGAAELIKALMEMLPGTLGIIRPTFEEYPNRRDKNKIVTFIPQNRDFRYTASDLIDFFSANHADSILLINPDNPSGNFIPLDDILKLAHWCETNNVRLIVDESFVDFSLGYVNNTLLHDSILEKYPKLIVMKSISKSYGVPGIRLGIMCSADRELISDMKRKLSIWNINSFAEFFMQIFTKYEKDYRRACDKFIKERDDFEKKLNEISYLRVIPSQANYFLCEVLPPQNINELVLSLLKQFNILTRNCSSKEGLDGKQYMRIAVRSHDDNEILINALRLLL